jgi:hypothetical protein
MIRLEAGQFGWDFLLVNTETGEDQLIQSDWDYPGVASSFGWEACQLCGRTDGTVNCEHRTASEMISEAGDYLTEHVGDEIEDPGYFE